jgi:hypothetical protein
MRTGSTGTPPASSRRCRCGRRSCCCPGGSRSRASRAAHRNSRQSARRSDDPVIAGAPVADARRLRPPNGLGLLGAEGVPKGHRPGLQGAGHYSDHADSLSPRSHEPDCRTRTCLLLKQERLRGAGAIGPLAKNNLRTGSQPTSKDSFRSSSSHSTTHDHRAFTPARHSNRRCR